MTDHELFAGFERGRVAPEKWTHTARVHTAWLCVARLPLCEAIGRIRDRHRLINARNGKPRSYHETLTVAYARIIASRLIDGESFGEFCERNPDLLDAALSSAFAYYSPGVLFSEPARRQFVAPDVRPLPFSE